MKRMLMFAAFAAMLTAVATARSVPANCHEEAAAITAAPTVQDGVAYVLIAPAPDIATTTAVREATTTPATSPAAMLAGGHKAMTTAKAKMAHEAPAIMASGGAYHHLA